MNSILFLSVYLSLIFLLSITTVPLLSVTVSVDAQCSEQQTIANEGGIINYCYYDSVGIPTIGIGYNLQRSDAAGSMGKYGLSLSAVLDDCRHKTKTQFFSNDNALDQFRINSFKGAIQCASIFAPNQPPLVTSALNDMAFNLGCAGLNAFKQVHSAIIDGDYQSAANHAKDSKWCRQVGGRCIRDTNCIASGQ